MSTGKHETADAVAVLRRCPCEQRGGLRHHHRLECLSSAEPHVTAEVKHEEDRTIAFLVEELRVRAPGACGHPPVDAANIVAGKVDPRFRVFHPPAPEPRSPRPGTACAAGAVGVQGEARRPRSQADEVGGGEGHPRQSTHAPDRAPCPGPAGSVTGVHGTATRESSVSTTRSASMPSASASKLSSTRCRSASWAMA